MPINYECARTVPPGHDYDAAEALADLMSNLSEDYYAAGWLLELEFHLFRAAYEGDDDLFPLNAHEKASLIALHKACGGWWTWDKHAAHERFCSDDEWLSRYSTHKP